MANPTTGRPEKPVSGDQPDTAAVALVLRDLRHRAGLTLRQLADCINYSVATLSTVASGKSLPRWDVVKAYAEGCDATNEELAELHALWRRASARQKGANDTAADSGAVSRRRTRGKSASSLAPASPVDGPSLSAPRAETTVFAEGSRRNRGVTASLTFADAVAPDVDEPTLSLRIPSQRNTPAPCPERSLTDPGNSVPALMRHARATQPGTNGDHSNPFATALALCTTPDHFIALMNMLCKRSGLTPPELSRHSKKARHPISKSTFHGILHGHKLPRTEVLHAVLQACGCPSDQWPLWHHTRTRLKLAQLVNAQEEPMTRFRMLRTDPVARITAFYTSTLVLIILPCIVLVALSRV
jgi:transcriptional regulator with XRE-family HTH domain